MNLAYPSIPLLLLAVPVSAQTALLREGDPGPSGVAGQTITGLGNTAVNQTGGYAATISVNDGPTTLTPVWGNLGGGPGALLREESTFGTLTQTVFESFFGISASSVVYSPLVNDAGGSSGLDSVWSDDTVVGIEEMMIPGTADFIRFGSRPGVTHNGIPYFLGGITDTAGGSTQARALFMGNPVMLMMRTGDLLPNLPAPLSTSGVGFGFRFSSLATHSIVPVDIDSGSSSDDGAIAIDGAGLVLGGTLVRESLPVPASIGGIGGENWASFDYLGITEAGNYMITVETSCDTATDEFILRDGVIWAREGDVLDGQTLTGSIEAAFLNENNDIAFIWDIEASPSALEALYFNDTLILAEGDAVDWDGDGLLDPNITIENFTGTSAMTLAMDGSIYFTADVDVNGTDVEGYFVARRAEAGTNYCMTNMNTTGNTTSISSTGSASLATNNLVVIARDMPTLAFGFFVVSETQDFVPNPGGSSGNLCVGGNIGRYVGPGQIQNSGQGGTFSLPIDLTAIPQPMGFVSASIGDTWNFQAWHRDIGTGSAASNLSDGYSVIIE